MYRFFFITLFAIFCTSETVPDFSFTVFLSSISINYCNTPRSSWQPVSCSTPSPNCFKKSALYILKHFLYDSCRTWAFTSPKGEDHFHFFFTIESCWFAGWSVAVFASTMKKWEYQNLIYLDSGIILSFLIQLWFN